MTINLPVTIDTAKIPGTINGATVFGYGGVRDTGSADFDVVAAYNSTTSLTVLLKNSSATYGYYAQVNTSTNVPMTVANGDSVEVFVSVPVVGYSSSVQQSDGYDGRQIAASYQASSGQSITSTAVITMMGTKLYDTTNSYNTATGVYTVPSAGKYKVTGNFVTITSTSVPNSLNIRKNSSTIFRLTPTYVNTANNYLWTGSGIIDANAGDTIDFQILAGGAGTFYNSAVDNWFTIEKLSSPQTMSATEVVAASYYANSAKTSSTSSPFDFDTKIYDTHGAVTTGASWKFTAPIAGKYSVNVTTSVTLGAISVYAYKNGTSYRGIYKHLSATTDVKSGSFDLELNAGEYFDIRFGSSTTGDNDSVWNRIIISSC